MSPIDLAELRRRRAEQLAEGVLDVLVVGGAIVGAGITRDDARTQSELARYGGAVTGC